MIPISLVTITYNRYDFLGVQHLREEIVWDGRKKLSTGHVSRLNRVEKWAPFGSEAYACEELVAELGAAFLCAELSIKGELEHHASYLQNWLTVLKQDKTALFRAAADASRASDFLHSLQPAANADRAA